jgi:molybdopterin-guanine dinucleotide biosynthesis protein A
VDGLPAIEAAIRRGDRAVVSFFSDVDVSVADLRTVSRFGDPDMMFFNVNRPEDHLRAETLLSGEATAEEPDGAANPEGT